LASPRTASGLSVKVAGSDRSLAIGESLWDVPKLGHLPKFDHRSMPKTMMKVQEFKGKIVLRIPGKLVLLIHNFMWSVGSIKTG
jgi:hypothetical protein